MASFHCSIDVRPLTPFCICRCYGSAKLTFLLHLCSVGAGGTEVRLVHYFLFDGDLNKDFIKGLGLKFHVPFGEDEKLWDRPIRFASVDGGVWGESVVRISFSCPSDA